MNAVRDVQGVLEQVTPACRQRAPIFADCYTKPWEPLLVLAARSSMAKPCLTENWLTVEDLSNFHHLSRFELVRSWSGVLLPPPIRVVEPTLVASSPRWGRSGIWQPTNLAVTRVAPEARRADKAEKLTLAIPTRNEESDRLARRVLALA